MAMESLHVRIDSDTLKRINAEADSFKVSHAEYYRKKLSMDIPENPKKEATNNDIMIRINHIEHGIQMCYRLLVSILLINYGNDVSMRNVDNLSEDEINNIATQYNASISDILPSYAVTEGND